MSSVSLVSEGEQNSRPPAEYRERGTGFVLAALWALYALTLRQYLHGKRWMVVGALFILPAGLATLLRATSSKVPSAGLEFILVFMLIPQAILPLVALLFASGMIQDEQEEQTITYLLVRPLPKWAIYSVKLLATVTIAVLLTAIFTALSYVAIYLGGSSEVEMIPLRCLQAIAIHSLAVVAYCSLFGLLSLITKRSLIVGILYIVVIEGVLANLPFGIRLLTVIYYSRLIAIRSLEFTIALPRGTQNIAAEAWQFNVRQDPALLDHPQLGTCVAILLLGCLICAVLATFIFSKREFYVKTPESN